MTNSVTETFYTQGKRPFMDRLRGVFRICCSVTVAKIDRLKAARDAVRRQSTIS
jgi:hypothetical protein